MFERDERSPRNEKRNDASSEHACGGKYDPSIYKLIKRRRERYLGRDRAKFDRLVKTAACKLDRKEAA